jgi:hypothetical protein
MRVKVKTIIGLFVVILLFPKICTAQLNWELDYNSANFAFIVLDYNTYKLENGYFAKYKYDSKYDQYGIPFNIVYNAPYDFGNILFAYKSTNDTLFYASIEWAGYGKIIFPKVFDTANLFTYDSIKTTPPYKTEYYKYMDEISDELFHVKADSAWKSIEKLSILKEFSKTGNVFRAGLYLYAPEVGMFNPKVAKWIIFLYRGQIIVSVQNKIVKSNDYALLQNYPNPFNPTTTINYSVPKTSFVTIKVYDVLGRAAATLVNENIQAGNHSVIFNTNKLVSGIYFYRMESGSYSQTKKLLILK